MLFSFFRHWWNAKGLKSLSNPRLAEFYSQVVLPSDLTSTEKFREIKAIRKQLCNNRRMLHFEDLGAGSRRFGLRKNRTVAQIARSSMNPAKYNALFYRIARYINAENILELGTSFGISTAYLSLACPEAKILTFEGVEEIKLVASEVFQSLHLKNICQVTGNLDEKLSMKLEEIEKVDLVIFDANHRYTPTIRYFELCLNKITDSTVFIFDDIHWSEEMQKAWKEIQSHPRVGLTIDLFKIGLVFFKKYETKQQHWVLRF